MSPGGIISSCYQLKAIIPRGTTETLKASETQGQIQRMFGLSASLDL